MRIGSLFSGAGGLDLAALDLFPEASVAWHSEIDTAAMKVLNHHWPDVPNLGDITAVDWATVPPVDILTGGFPCFPAGTLVDTSDGYLPIEEVRSGQLVRTHNGRYRPVTQLMARDDAPIVDVTVMGVPTFGTTGEHPFYVRAKARVWNNDRRTYDRVWRAPEWVAAGELSVGDFVGFRLDAPSDASTIGVPLARLIGRFLGDGWVANYRRSSRIVGARGSRVTSKTWKVYVCCARDEEDDVRELISAAGYAATVDRDRTVTKFIICSKELVERLEGFGRLAHGKRLPGWVFSLPLAEQEALWRGWTDADGSRTKIGEWRTVTVSPVLAHGMARVARNVFQRAVSIYYSPSRGKGEIEGRAVNQRPTYTVSVPPRNREAFTEDGWVWVPVRAVKPTERRERVYNLSVAEDETYTAWGIAVHNCTDVSLAGQRAGLMEGTRSGLWSHMARAVAVLRPKFVLIENVRGLLSAQARRTDGGTVRDMESGSGGVGAPADGSLRALGAVLGDLSGVGFDACWTLVRASDVGCCHQRARVFIVAYPADSDFAGLEGREPASGRVVSAGGGVGAPGGVEAAVPSEARGVGSSAATPRASDGSHGGPNQRGSKGDLMLSSAVASLLPTPSVADAMGGHLTRSGARRDELLLPGVAKAHAEGALLPTPTASDGDRDDCPSERARRTPGLVSIDHYRERWGDFAAAIARQEALSRPAPAPTELSAKGNPRLSPAFAEWLMFWPAGWVTDPEIGLSRNEMLRCIGNGVVPIQAVAAVRHLLSRIPHPEVVPSESGLQYVLPGVGS